MSWTVQVSPHLHVEWIEEEAVVLDPSTKNVHHLNTPAALVLALIQEHGYEGALEAFEARFGDARAREDLPPLIEDMVGRGLLVSEDGPIPEITSG